MRILVHTVFHSLVNEFCQFFTHHKIRKTLPKIYSVVLYGQLVHYSKNSGTNSRKLALNIHLRFSAKVRAYMLLKDVAIEPGMKTSLNNFSKRIIFKYLTHSPNVSIQLPKPWLHKQDLPGGSLLLQNFVALRAHQLLFLRHIENVAIPG